MWNNDGFIRVVISILSGKHVNFSLINSQLTNVNIQEENISALHTWIKELRDLQLIRLFFAHNSGTFLNSTNTIFTGNIHNFHPILIGSLIDLLRCPNKLDIGHFHSSSFPYFDEIFSYSSNFLEITIEFPVKHSEIISHPKNKYSSSINHFVYVDCSEKALRNVHSSWRFESIIASEKIFL